MRVDELRLLLAQLKFGALAPLANALVRLAQREETLDDPLPVPLPVALEKPHLHARADRQRLAHQPPHLDHAVEVLLAQVPDFLLIELVRDFEWRNVERNLGAMLLAHALLRLVADEFFDNFARCLQRVLEVPEQVIREPRVEVGNIFPCDEDCLVALGIDLRHRLNLVAVGRHPIQVDTAAAADRALAPPVTTAIAGGAARYRDAHAVDVNRAETGVLEEGAPELDKFFIGNVARQGPT